MITIFGPQSTNNDLQILNSAVVFCTKSREISFVSERRFSLKVTQIHAGVYAGQRILARIKVLTGNKPDAFSI